MEPNQNPNMNTMMPASANKKGNGALIGSIIIIIIIIIAGLYFWGAKVHNDKLNGTEQQASTTTSMNSANPSSSDSSARITSEADLDAMAADLKASNSDNSADFSAISSAK